MARTLLIISGVMNGITGMLLTFIPEELLLWTDGEAGEAAILYVSIVGAAMLGFGMMNYMGRNAVYGGIYGKPIILGNLLFHTVAAVHLIKFSMNTSDTLMIPTAVAGTLYFIFAAGFIRLNFFPPDLKTSQG
jgi:hypothetical protein